MRERYRDGKIQGVVVRTLGRLSRRQIHAAILSEEMEHCGVVLHSATEDLAEEGSMGQFVRMVLAFVAEMEREKIMDRTMTGRTNAVLKGSMKAVSTHKLRYGFAWADTAKTTIILNDEEAEVVRWMAELYAEGTATYTIRQQLNEPSVLSPSGHEWLDCTIMRILGDRRITGEGATAFRHKAKRYKTHHDTVNVPDGTYPAIISTELFNKIERRMAMNKVSASRATKNPEEFLLRAGYVRCRNHGSIVSKALDSVIWHKVEELADYVTLIEQAIQLATHDKKLERDASAIDASIMVRKLEGEKAQIKAGLLDREREQATSQEILAWCMKAQPTRCMSVCPLCKSLSVCPAVNL